MPIKTIQATTRIPPLSYQDYPVHIYFRIKREGAWHVLEVSNRDRWVRSNIEVSLHDLAALNKQLQETMESIVDENTQSGSLTGEHLREQIRPLAEVGRSAFKKIFGDPQVLASIRDLQLPGRRFSVQIVSEDFFVPWELMYPVSLDEPLSYHNFWGMNHIIFRKIVQQVEPGALVSYEIDFASLPSLGLLTYSGLDHVVKHEIPFFEKLASGGKIVLFKLRPLQPDKRPEELQELKRFWDKTLNLVHFACHAFYKDGSPHLSHVLLSDEFPVTLSDLEAYDFVTKSNPLIVMNACETSNLNPLYTSHFAGTFLRLGARGVVATDCLVPDAFAAEFAEVLYEHLLAGEPLGESLLATRQYFLEKRGNPSGLLYSMYAPPSIRLAHRRLK